MVFLMSQSQRVLDAAVFIFKPTLKDRDYFLKTAITDSRIPGVSIPRDSKVTLSLLQYSISGRDPAKLKYSDPRPKITNDELEL